MIEYYNENEMRAYPVYENATQRGLDSTVLPQDILVDLMLTVPRALAGSLFLASVTITPAIVSIAIASAAGGVFAATYAQPVVPYRPYALTPMTGMASGYVVFGKAVAGSSSAFSFISDSTSSSGLDSKAVHPIESGVVLSLGKYLALEETRLKGIVKLEPGPNVTVRFDDGKLKIGLTDRDRYAFVGPCDRQAMFDNCGGPPIRTINGIGPDVDGAITIEVDNA